MKPDIFPYNTTKPYTGNRRVHLRGTHNFRDLGGYPTRDGRRVCWGVFYRSDHLHNLKIKSQALFNSLGLHTLVDLRSEGERIRQPDRLPPDANLQVIHLPVTDPSNPNANVELGERVRDKKIEGLDARAIILEDYKRLATIHTPDYKQYFHHLLEAQGQPLLVHCTAGKDRTGFAAAITLRMLGVSMENIVEDYLLSNHYTRRLRWMILTYLRLSRGKNVADFVRPLSVVRTEYLETAFKTLETEYGSFEGYTRQGLGLDEEQIERLKDYILD